MRKNEIRQMIRGERQLIPFGSDLTPGTDEAGVIDQHVDPRLRRSDFSSHAPGLGDRRKIREMRLCGAVCVIACAVLGEILRRRSRVASARLASRATNTRRAPMLASLIAAASPIPEVPPVRTTTFPCMPIMAQDPRRLEVGAASNCSRRHR